MSTFQRSLVLFVFAALGAAGCTPARTYCEAQAECDDLQARPPLGLDLVGADNDSVDVCVANVDGTLATLRANEEAICQEAAQAYEIYMACVARVFTDEPGDACDALSLPLPFGGRSNPCDDELDDYFDALGDAGDDCSPNEE